MQMKHSKREIWIGYNIELAESVYLKFDAKFSVIVHAFSHATQYVCLNNLLFSLKKGKKPQEKGQIW